LGLYSSAKHNGDVKKTIAEMKDYLSRSHRIKELPNTSSWWNRFLYQTFLAMRSEYEENGYYIRPMSMAILKEQYEKLYYELYNIKAIRDIEDTIKRIDALAAKI
jgi:hypothetical protein